MRTLAQDLAAIEGVQTLVELEEVFRPIAASYGFDTYAGGILAGLPEIVMFLSSWPRAWMTHYAANGYGARDVAVQEAIISPVSRTWTELQALRPTACPDIFAAAREFGWNDGLIVPVHGPGKERGMICLAGSRVGVPRDLRTDLEALCSVLYNEARTIHCASMKYPRLSPREHEALALVAKGYGDDDIASLLNVSKTTAHSHVERAKRRLNAATRAEAVAIAFRRGIFFGLSGWCTSLTSLIDPLP